MDLMRRSPKLAWAFTAAAGLVLCAMAAAQQPVVVFTDFGPGMSFNTANNTVSRCVTGPESSYCGPAGTRVVASQFKAGGTYVLAQLDLALEYSAGAADSGTVHLVNDADGAPGNQVLESWTATLPSGAGTLTLTSGGGVTLQAGQRYWVVASAGGDTQDFWWGAPGVDLPGWTDANFSGGDFFAYHTALGTEEAFDVLGYPVGAASAVNTAEVQPITAGDLIVPDWALSGLLEITPAGALVQAIPLPAPYALDTGNLQLLTALVRPSDHAIFLNAEDAQGVPTVVVLDNRGQLLAAQPVGGGWLQQIAFDPADPAQNTVLGGTPFLSSAVAAVNPFANTVTTKIAADNSVATLNNIIGLTTDASGRIYASQWGSGTVYLFDRDGDRFGPTAVAGYPDYYDTDGIALADGDLLIAEHSANQAARLGPSGSETNRFGLLGTTLAPLIGPLIAQSDYVSADPATGTVYVGDQSDGNVTMFGPSGDQEGSFVLPGAGIGEAARVPEACAADATGSLHVAVGGLRYLFSGGDWVQTIAVTNTSGVPVAGPVSLVLAGLSPTAALDNAQGAASSCTAVSGPYIDVTGPAGLAPGAIVSITLYFADPSMLPITYRARVVAGAGTR